MTTGTARSYLPTDSIIGSVAELADSWRAEYGDLSQVSRPVDNVIRDVLHWMGIAENGIQMVLGENDEPMDSSEHEHCALCDQPAVGLVPAPDGWRMVCAEHGHEAKRRGMPVIRQRKHEGQ